MASAVSSFKEGSKAYMRIFACFDDTDTLDCGRGTGKLARWFEEELPESCSLWAVVRQQLLVDPAIPYTSHNSSACAVIDAPEAALAAEIARRAALHVEKHAVDGSDPGVCVAAEGDPAIASLMEFGRLATRAVVDQTAAMRASAGVHLSGHGGTNDGIIGAAAGVGLTAWGWAGRLIEYGPRRLRDFGGLVTVEEIEQAGIGVLPIDKDGALPLPHQLVDTQSWLRPRLIGGRPLVPVIWDDPAACWVVAGRRAKKSASLD